MAETRFNLPFEPNINSMREYWRSLSRPVQVSAVAVVAAIIIFIVFLIAHLTRTEMEILFQGMQPQEAQEVTEKLDEDGINYELEDGGTTIKVPREKQDHLRLQLSPDLYSRGMGFQVFEEDGLMISDHDRRKQWKVVLQDELARTISSLGSVEWARVHLVTPEDELFVRDQADPSASIFLELPAMETLTEDQARGILSLVAGSVEGLEPDNISMVDARGEVHHDAYRDLEKNDVPAEVHERMEAEQKFENNLESKIMDYMEVVFGPGNVVAMVNAELDFDVHETKSITYDDEPVERAIHRIQEWEEGEGPDLEEVGEPNSPGYQAPITDGDYEREYLEETINYEISEIQEYISSAQGGVERLSATVVVNREEEEIAGIEEDISTLVAAAVGHDPERGDAIAVQSMPFDTTLADEIAAREDREQMQQIVTYGVLAGILLLMFVMVLFFLRQRARAYIVEEEEELLEEAVEPSAFDIEELIESETAEEKLEDDTRQQLQQMAEEDPENVAYLLRNWLAE